MVVIEEVKSSSSLIHCSMRDSQASNNPVPQTQTRTRTQTGNTRHTHRVDTTKGDESDIDVDPSLQLRELKKIISKQGGYCSCLELNEVHLVTQGKQQQTCKHKCIYIYIYIHKAQLSSSEVKQ